MVHCQKIDLIDYGSVMSTPIVLNDMVCRTMRSLTLFHLPSCCLEDLLHKYWILASSDRMSVDAEMSLVHPKMDSYT